MGPDTRLTARLADDLEAAFPAVVHAHAGLLVTIAVRLLGDREDAEEVAQDAFVRAYRALGTYQPERVRALALRPWLAAITVRLARNRRRRRIDRDPPRPLDPIIDGPMEPAGHPDAEPQSRVLAADAGRTLAAALLELRPAQRAAVVLRHVAGLSTAETAAALGRPEPTVRSDLFRGLEHLRTIVHRLDPELAPQEASR